ncbi:hypothetical protein RO3G_08655 [Rhizopus delemar RA 99-880]|uniref:RNA-directed DNA polymerase n=1 Tax=Rhizopus delemar (strain RA 99-880 / ATCC MYA-4621 / FGSC 9543 / NRRL 43880) TaxID=246409 RepID=I1C670_RHIO9|nr:hypothetical protein RO3G_08650 [Rhizopus delemar RA 99-880]EIE83950.1 hypothetical protein RO3G_08655 [Rhizopus delemar RA 99-880]|eukprot:EIE83945.1 hypothetical protein RO3G_08650 [Rhizopus delemar RA 99-880]
MNSSINQSPSKNVEKDSADEVAKSLDRMDLETLESRASNSSIHPRDDPSIETDVEMDEATNSSPAVPSSDPPNYLERLMVQKTMFFDLIEKLNNNKASFILENKLTLLEENEKQLSYAVSALNDVNALIASQFELRNHELKGSGSKNSSPKDRLIPSREIPRFNVNPTASALYQLTLREGDKNVNPSNEPSLDMFIRDFQRKFLDYDVSIEDHWLHYLEVSFEKSDSDTDHDWFERFIKRRCMDKKTALNWDQAKEVLKQRFDLASQTTPEMWFKNLINFRQERCETLTQAMDRYRLFSLGAKVNMHDNTFLIGHFVSRLHTVKFQEMVQATITRNLPSLVSASSNTNGESVYSTRNLPIPLPKEWNVLESILIKEMANLESALLNILKDKKKEENTKKLGEHDDNANTKKRKMVHQSEHINQKVSKSSVEFQQEIADLKKQGVCTFCKTAKYSPGHYSSCSVRLEYVKRKHGKQIVSNSSKGNDKTVSNLELSNSITSISQTNKSPKNRVTDLSLSPSNNESTSQSYELNESSDDEFEFLYKHYDRNIICSNKNINANFDEEYNKNVFAIRNNKVGEDDSLFESDNVAYSPVTPITLNNVNTYGIIDTGARVSVMNKKFAIDNNIKFHSVPGNLVLANGDQIPRMRSVDYVNVEYDNIDYIIKHKFDIIDDHASSYNSVKHKSTEKELDDSILDKAYKPNISRAGTEKEQKVFDMAIKPYIEANKKLNKNSLCNIKEAVLHLPTPKDYVANIKQYPIAYTLQPKVMDIINSWLDEVLDPRMLNKVLPVDNHQLPLINDIFNSMSGAVIFSTLDLKSAFNQFPVNKDDQIKTTFTAPNNLQYMYRGAPFGISTISQLFSRIMLTLFKDLPYVKCFVDDICIFSSSIHAHFLHVKKVLQILTDANLKINFEKTYLAKSAVYLLGYSISASGKQIDARKLTNIFDWPRPTTQKQVQSFLGFVNYFRQHTPNAALLMAPLDALRCHDEKVKGPFEWTKEHQMHFDSIKHILSSELMLSHPDLSKPFCIATDSSDYSTGCCLYQEFEVTKPNGEISKIKRYIGFMSRSLSRSEKRYSVTMRELLGVVYALTQFHKFIWGTRFTLYTDHKALCYIHSQKNANSMLIKWLDVILDYNFSVIHVPGLENVLPDKLSRLYPPKDTFEHESDIKKGKRLSSYRQNHAISETINTKKKHRAYSKYNAAINIISVIQETTTSDAQKDIIQVKENTDIRDIDYNINDQYLFYVQSAQPLYSDYLTPPLAEHQQLLIDAHNKIGHYGAEQMVKRLHNDGIHWPNLIGDCIKFIKQCKDCMKHNIEKRGFHPLRSIYSYYPGDHYAIDLGGPMHTTSVYNNNYFMVIIDVCTRFCILRALPDKRSDTILRSLIDVFSTMGFPTKLQSDNGTEFKNSLSKDLADAMGYDHRFITPLHPSANGISERTVQSVKKLLAKATHGVGNDWDLYLPSIQLAMNNRISKRLNSTPFSLMFARKMNEPYGFRSDKDKLKEVKDKPPMSHEELMKRIDYMTDIVFPAIVNKTKAQIELEQAKFNDSHRLVDYAPGSHVMVRIPNKSGQLAPAYEGPYTVVRKNKGNAYILRDETGVLMPRAYTSVELKLISNEEVIELDDEGNEIINFEIEAVINHRGPPKNREYLVRWKNYSSEWDEWLSADKFNDPNTLRNYWKNLGKKYIPPKNAPITNSPSSSELLKSTPSGTISTAMKHFSSDDENNSNLVDKKSTIKSNVGSSARPVKRTRRNKPPTNNACDTPSTATRSSKRLKSLHK